MYESFVIFTVASVRPRTKTEYQTTFSYKPFHRNYTLEDLFHHDFELDAKILNYWNQDTKEKKLNKKYKRLEWISQVKISISQLKNKLVTTKIIPRI